ncbi:hypothetical protein [Rhodoplanes sp. SY1]|uniref:hypothetical protein n=1 Tax=Rhodoplanes sp. SY1 TaxID=3166646 RepID=UPI0038B4A1C0
MPSFSASPAPCATGRRARPLDLQALFTLYDTARGAVGTLDGVTAILPSTPLFLYMDVRKEALPRRRLSATAGGS